MNFDFITERLAVGQKIDNQEFADALKAAGITHAVNLFGEAEPVWAGPSLSFPSPQDDDGTPRRPEVVLACVRYAFDAIRDGGKVYVHCQWGIGRAPSVAYAILRRFGLTREEAAALVNAKRPRAATWGWEKYIPSIEDALA